MSIPQEYLAKIYLKLNWNTHFLKTKLMSRYSTRFSLELGKMYLENLKRKLIQRKWRVKVKPIRNSKNDLNTKQYNLRDTLSLVSLKSQDILLFYEKVFNGYTSWEDVNEIEYEKSRRESSTMFPWTLSEQNEYFLETHENLLIQRSLNITTKVINVEVGNS